MISGFFAGVAGGLMGFTRGWHTPKRLGLQALRRLCGDDHRRGAGLARGSLLGAAFVTLLPERFSGWARSSTFADMLSALREIAFGLLIIAFLIFEPHGLAALARKLKDRPPRIPQIGCSGN